MTSNRWNHIDGWRESSITTWRPSKWRSSIIYYLCPNLPCPWRHHYQSLDRYGCWMQQPSIAIGTCPKYLSRRGGRQWTVVPSCWCYPVFLPFIVFSFLLLCFATTPRTLCLETFPCQNSFSLFLLCLGLSCKWWSATRINLTYALYMESSRFAEGTSFRMIVVSAPCLHSEFSFHSRRSV